MAEALELRGIGASPGFARGPAHVAEIADGQVLPAVGPDGARAELEQAMADAVRALEELARDADPESAGILDFQIEMLQDPAMLDMAGERMDAGDGAALAWAGGLDAYIADIEADDDDAMRARAGDIVDIRNRVLNALTGTVVADFPDGAIFVGRDMEPSRFLAHDWSGGGGIVLSHGSTAGHLALLARARNVPMVTGLGAHLVEAGQMIDVDGTAGLVVLRDGGERTASGRPHTTPATPRLPKLQAKDLTTANGTAVRVSVNINAPADLNGIDLTDIDGIGLLRTEFLLTSAADIVDEEKQHAAYARILSTVAGKPVTIRMLDLGGDKPLPGTGGAAHSFLGLRGTRLLLARPDMARVQARALMRAAVAGNLAVMLPMVTVPAEVDAIAGIFAEEAAHLTRRRIGHAVPPIGMMVEVPAAALMLDTFHRAAFFSLGTNDLAQYLMAASRDDGRVADLYAQAAAPMLRLIHNSVALAETMQRPIGICGDMAGEPDHLGTLLRCGLRHFSVAPGRLPALRSALAGLNADGTPAGGV